MLFLGIEREIASLQLEVCSVFLYGIGKINFLGINELGFHMQLQEKKLVAEIKKTAKTGNEVSLCDCELN